MPETQDKLTPHQLIIKRWPSLAAMAKDVTAIRALMGKKECSKATVQGWWVSGVINWKHHPYVFFAGKKLDPKLSRKDFYDEDAYARVQSVLKKNRCTYAKR